MADGSGIRPWASAADVWRTREPVGLGREALDDLIANRVPAVRIPAFASVDEVAALTRELQDHAIRTRSISQVTRLGISQYQQGLCGSKDEYFATAARVAPEFEGIFARSFDPVDRFLSALRAVGFDAEVAREPGYGRYWAGTGKLRNGFSPIHVDFAPQDCAGWSIADISVQLAWNFYLQVPDRGGELLLWDRQWRPEDDVHMTPDSYWYTADVVAGAARLELGVHAGDVLILNSRNFHAVAESTDRLAFGSFAGVYPDGRVRIWS